MLDLGQANRELRRMDIEEAGMKKMTMKRSFPWMIRPFCNRGPFKTRSGIQ